METIDVEGYRVLAEKSAKGGWTFTIPGLPGVVGQVKDWGDVVREATRLIGAYFEEMAAKKPKLKRNPKPGHDDGNGERKKQVKK